MKKIALLTIISCIATQCTAFAGSIDTAAYDAATGKYTISGTADANTPVRIEVLKNGYIFKDLTKDNAKDAYMYTDFVQSGTDGKYSFSVNIPSAASNYSVRVSYFDGESDTDSFATYQNSDMDTAIAGYIANTARTEAELDALITSYYGKLGVDYTKYRDLSNDNKTKMFTQLQTRIEADTSYSADKFKTYVKAFFITEELNAASDADAVNIIETNHALLEIDTASKTWDAWNAMQADEKKAIAAQVKTLTLNTLPSGFKDAIIFGELKTALWNEQIGILEKYDAETSISTSDWSKVLDANKQTILTQFKSMVTNGTVSEASNIKSVMNSLIATYNTTQQTTTSPSGGGTGGSASGGFVVKPIQNTVTEPTEPFTDLDTVEWARVSIIALYDKGIVSGKGENQFCPQDYLTREELAAMAARAFELGTSAEEVFTDVPQDRWSAGYIAAAKNAGIISGVSEDSFMPAQNITRQDTAVILYRAAIGAGKEFEGGTSKGFSDAEEISEYAREAVEALHGAEIISGSNGKFNPHNNITRAEAARMIYGIMKYCGGIK